MRDAAKRYRRLAPYRKERDDKGIVYFIQPVNGGPVKIGFTTNLSQRFREIQACSPVELQVIFSKTSFLAQEHEFHREIAEHRLHGEWFRDCAQVHAMIARFVHAQIRYGKDEHTKHGAVCAIR